ncbi:5-oxoprolinase subunit PxpA [uncultured Psychroserpens sp.]|uniref:5-oxoprolinase subunit PxpA n=1 Tax=uncultured Psychroserpens sp. TaxID=255436 RepID=UPI00262D10C8|nr:5-oxoprolinase subunit PxpA [uncultured Psychroserpens sp.]
MIEIDINCDLGEGVGNEAFLMPFISSCNIACGGHAGNKMTMSIVADLAEKYNVKIGAHPSFPDKENFGRKLLNMSPEALYDTVYTQIMSLKTILGNKGLNLHHVKPHGALYNAAVVDKSVARTIIKAVNDIDSGLVLYAPYHSLSAEIAKQEGLQVMYEAFVDRNYNEDLTLVSRQQKTALIDDADHMFEHMCHMILNGKIMTVTGVEIEVKADTFCIHGDHKNVLNNLEHLVGKLKENNIEIS